ncbi:MAG: hypothetical protein GY753_02080 [Gammaproteobacteria bacterium]|nr:hypothetical protein [Gammaproteobacteria bacterium]
MKTVENQWIMALWIQNRKGDGEMAITDNWGYVKRMIAGSFGPLMAQSAASAESKFLPLSLPPEARFVAQPLHA